MVLRLAAVLDVPLRQQNVLLEAAGYAQMFKARPLADPDMQQVRRALEYMLQQQEPYPAVVVDRHWYMSMGNTASGRLLAWLVEPQDLDRFRNAEGHLSLLRLLFHPAGMRPYVQNWHEVAGHLIERLHREAVSDGQDTTTVALLDELLSYPDVPRAWQVPSWDAYQAPVLTVAFAKGALALRFFSTITTLGTPHDITLQDLRLECFFPADTATERDITALSGQIEEKA
jgi:hypothetical protein